MAEIILERVWNELCLKFTLDQEKIADAWDEIFRCYRKAERAYHTLDHIRSLVELIDEYSVEIDNKSMLLFTAFYHDIVYIPGSSDNEKNSAAIAVAWMKQLQVPDKIIQETNELILLTKSHADVNPSTTQDMLLFLDMDLSILGTSSDVYHRYCENVRREFKAFSDFLFRNGRQSFLKSQLERPLIFHTIQFRNRYEAQARINMLSELNEE
jgi:predicted metal-dependent HD superfamily phosphohydrolase